MVIRTKYFKHGTTQFYPFRWITQLIFVKQSQFKNLKPDNCHCTIDLQLSLLLIFGISILRVNLMETKILKCNRKYTQYLKEYTKKKVTEQILLCKLYRISKSLHSHLAIYAKEFCRVTQKCRYLYFSELIANFYSFK